MGWLRIVFLTLLMALSTAAATGCGGGDGDSDDGSGDLDAGDNGPGDIAFMEACDIADDQCVEGDFCFEYGEGGSLCSHECSSATDCPAPSSGCNNKGICKKP